MKAWKAVRVPGSFCHLCRSALFYKNPLKAEAEPALDGENVKAAMQRLFLFSSKQTHIRAHICMPSVKVSVDEKQTPKTVCVWSVL